MDVRKRQNVNIYKANTKKTGSAVQFSLKNDNTCMFMECAKQVNAMDDPRPYDWDNKIVVKLGLQDISQLLFYLTLNKPQIPMKLYHQSPKGGNKTVELKYQEFKGRPGYFISTSWQKDKGQDVYRVSAPISMYEGEILKVALKVAIECILGWCAS